MSTKAPTRHLLIVDPQNDFLDVSGAALPVAGAAADMERLARFVESAADRLDAITVTLDSHHAYDIAHPTFWRRGDGAPVTPFTQILAVQVRDGVYVTRDPGARERALAYLDELERLGRYTLMVWPVHCEIGSWGHNLPEGLRIALDLWQARRLRPLRSVMKGMNAWTEHYSAMQAEVPDADDPETQLNAPLIAQVDAADEIVIAGEASSHCVRATTEHLVAHMRSRRPQKVVLLADCMSPVAGFEQQEREFLDAMRAQGVRVTSSEDYLRQLQAAAVAA